MANTVQQVRILLLLEILLTVKTSAVPLMQIELQELANSLEIRVKVVDNLRHDGKNHIVQTFIKNSGHSPIPDSGWTLYFHSMLPVFPDILLQKGKNTVDLHVEKVRFGLVQGDLFYMEPIEGFVPLKAGEERKYNVIVNLWAVSRTDFMPLWYVVSEDKSGQPYIVHSTSSFDLGYVRPFKDVRQWKRQRGDQYNPYTPEDRLARLKFTDTGKTKLIIPTPKNTRIDDTVKLSSVDTSWGILVDEIYFNETALFLKELYDFNFISNGSSNSIVLSRNNTFSKQGYSVIVSPEQDRIFLQSNTSHGMFYAIQSLRAILEEYNSTNIPSIVIEDEPRFEWRGMHLDVARNFHSVGDVKRLIQAMSMYKMNALHLHLTDDEGWRLEIDGLPELTDVGGKRCHDLNETRCVIPQFGSGPFANTSGSGYYTKNDYRDILRFANKHFVTVIPEFDMPGHSHAAIVSMEQRYRKYIEAGNQTAAEEFRIIDPDDTTFYASVQNWRDDVMNPCIESTYALIGKVMERVNALHEDVQPLLFYHFGGDEVPHEVWSKSPKCEELLHQNSALNVTHGLKNYFAKRIAALAALKNMSLGGWEDGFTDGQPRPAPIHTDQMSGVELYVHPWNNIWEWGGGSNAYEYANAGYKVILAPATNLYFDHPQEPGPEERGLYWATRFTDTKKVFKFMPDAFYENIFEDRSGNPLSKEDICGEDLSKCTQLEKPENIIGIQGALWSETVRTSGNMDFMIFPRLLALAERSWYKAGFESTPQNEELFEDEWNAFANAVGSREFRRLNEMDIAFRIPPPGGRALRDGSVQVTTTYPGLDVELSEDNGRSWQIVQQDLINDSGRGFSSSFSGSEWESVLLRSTFRNEHKVRHSRVVELKREVSNPNTAQNMVDYIAEHLAVHLEVISNLIKDPQRYITLKVDFTNNGSDEVANGNWKIYFYSVLGAKPGERLECGLTVGHVGGDLYYFEPTKGTFKGIATRQTLTCFYKNSEWMASRTDNVPNWFVAAPGMKAKKLEKTASKDLNYVGYFDSPQKWKRSEDDKFDPFTPAKRYDMLKRGPSEKRAYKIIPSPVNMLVYDQPTMPFDSKSWVVTGSKDFEGEMQFLADKLKMKIKATSSSFQKQIQFIKTTDDIGGKEAYLLGITPNTSKIEIKASDNAGAFYGAQTLLSLLEDNGGVLPQSIVGDFPRYEYRGVMIDVARNFKSKAWMLKLIDTMAMYKLNKLHLHLSDDESWRIEIPAIPELTEVASKRCHSEYKDKCVLPQWGSGPDSDTSGSGFYTVEDYREMLEYAKARHIEIIPEIDMPGHSAAAMAAMEKREDDIDFMKMHGYIPLPESLLLNDRGIHENVSSFQKWTKNAMNPCMNSTYRFVELVVDGLKRLHMPIQPLRIFHMGGSEVVQGAWVGSHECLMNSELKTFDMAALRRFFMNRVTDVVATKGLKLGVWEDGVYAENKPNPITDFKSDVFVYPWDNRWELDHAKRPSEFADAGYKVVLPLVTHLYFDLAQEPDPETRGFYWATRYSDTHKLFGLMPDDIYANADVDSMGNTVTLESLCENQPCPQPNKTENIIGLQACVWTDIIRTEEQIENMIFPRLLALAERAWHEADWESIKDKTERDSKKQADWEVFSDVMGHKELPRLERNSIFYLVDPPGAKVVNKVLTTNVRYPNHTVELSRDGGKVWQTFQEQELPLGEHEIHFRTRSPVLGRYSRAVKMTAHVSDHIKGLNQGELDELASSLQIRVKVLDNLRNDGNRHIVQTALKNIGQSPIPHVGWTLYFHSMLLAFPDSFQHEHNKTVDMDIEKVQFGVVQGDMYYMKPIPGFAPISPGKERVYNIIVQLWAISKTDFMPLWYVSSDTEGVTPRVVKSTSSFDLDYVEDFGDIRQWKRSRADRYNPYSPQDRWSRFRFLGNQKDEFCKESVVIPTPKKIECHEDGPFIMFDYSWKVFDVNGSFSEIAKYMKEMFKVDSSVSDGRNLIKLIKNATLPGQAYLLQIEAENENIVLQSSTPQGMFYAVQSLRAIIDDTNRVYIPSMTLEDAPRYEWRGMHLDVARNFHSLEDVKRLIKAMAMYKMNLLHLHLTDDEGWRIEIPGLPELTKIGSRRCHDLNETQCIIPQFGSGPFADSSGTGYYTTAEYKDLLRFAKKHFVTVVPEFDTPGHCHAAVVSMECRYNKFKMTGDETSANEYRLVDPEDVSFYRSVQNWRDNAINPCINSTYKFIAKIIDEIKSMHQDIQPLVTYHFGGDEVAKEAWTHSPMCQKFLTSNPKYNVTHGLKNYFVTRVAEIAAAKNVKLGGWDDGFLNGQSSPEPIPISEFSNAELFVNTWNNIWEWGGGSNAYKFANAGFKVILTQATNLYFDHPQEPDPEERGLYWATRFTDTKKVFRFMPESLYDNIFEDKSGGPLSKVEICGEDMSKCTLLEKPENVIGMQGALWSETVRTSQNMDYMIYPRLLALAERSWHKASFEDQSDNIEVFENEWISFSEALGLREFKRLDDLGISFRVPPPGARLLENGEMQVSTTYPGLGVEVSKDNGNTWQQVPEEIVNNPNRSTVVKSEGDWHSVKLRTTFRNGDKTRYSRSITLNKEVARPVVEQYMLNYIAENLLVHVEVIDNLNKDYNNYMTVKLELTNNGSMNIPSSAWRIYFYSLYGAKDSKLRCGLTVGHVNGGLFYIEPTPGSFPGIPAMQSLNPCTYNNKWWMVSRTDNMPNWFVTAPGMKAMKLKATESERLSYVGKFDTAAKWKRTREDRFDPYTAPERYDILRRNPSSKPLYRVVPTPMMSTFSKHETIHVDHLFVVVESQEFKRESQFLAETLKVNNVTTALDSSKQIKFEMKQNLGGSDAYEINISPETHTVVIQAQEAPGAFYGAQTLISLVEDNDGNIPKATIRDAPRFGYRGVMLDVARNFKPKNWMLKFIDVMATYKLNKLHLHLSDDEAWRIEIPDIPGLTQIASKRCHSEYSDECVMPQLGSGPDTDTIGSGFYTVDDYREILDYANARHIEVIPEIDMPGHSAAAITVMEKREDDIDFMESHAYGPLPESWLLYDHKFTPSVYSVQKWLKNAMNPCMNSTYRFVERVVDGLKELHRPVQPLRIFHMGGDEVAHGAWDESRECFDNVEFRGKDTAALQRVFMSRVSRIISDKGLNLGVWEDGVYADDKPNPITDFKSDVFVYPWNNRWGTNKAKRSSEFADAGYKVILPLATHLYFDMPQEPDPESRGLYWATRFIDAHKVFGLMPDNIFANVDVDRMGNSVSLEDLCGNAVCPQPNKTKNIIGLQACMWAEVMRTEEQFHNMAFPRLLALAERAWHRANWEEIEDRKARDAYRSSDWEAFADVLGYKELARLEKKQVFYLVEPPGARVEGDVLMANTRYPNHVVEISMDGGDSWNEFQQQTLANGKHKFHFRTKSPVLGRVSRPVELMAVVEGDGRVGSAASSTLTYLTILVTFVHIYMFWRVL